MLPPVAYDSALTLKSAWRHVQDDQIGSNTHKNELNQHGKSRSRYHAFFLHKRLV